MDALCEETFPNETFFVETHCPKKLMPLQSVIEQAVMCIGNETKELVEHRILGGSAPNSITIFASN